MSQSVISLLNVKKQAQRAQNKANILIFSNNNIINFQKIIEILPKKDYSRITKADILTENFFLKRLSLLQNIKFYTTLSSIEIDSFLSKYSLEGEYDKLKHKSFEDIKNIVWFKFEILLYSYINKNLLIEKNNFFGVLKLAEINPLSVIEDKEIAFLHSGPAEQTRLIYKFFDVFVFITDNNCQVFENYDIFYEVIVK